MTNRSTAPNNEFLATNHTVKGLQEYIGKNGMYHCNGLHFEIVIFDVRITFGRIQYLIAPVKGSGSIWAGSNVTIDA